MNFYSRKNNRLKGFDYSSKGAYFITICTDKRKRFFGNIVGGDDHIAPHTQLSEYGKAVEKYIVGIKGMEKFVIMPDHIHMIIVVDEEKFDVSKPIRTFKTLVSKELGFSLWQRTYYDHVIRNQQDYDEIWQYIDNNPTKWYLTKK